MFISKLILRLFCDIKKVSQVHTSLYNAYKNAIKDKANYLAFGSFFKSKLKPNAKRANLNILRWAKKNIKKPIVVIGGIDNLNYNNFRNVKNFNKLLTLSVICRNYLRVCVFFIQFRYY